MVRRTRLAPPRVPRSVENRPARPGVPRPIWRAGTALIELSQGAGVGAHGRVVPPDMEALSSLSLPAALLNRTAPGGQCRCELDRRETAPPDAAMSCK